MVEVRFAPGRWVIKPRLRLVDTEALAVHFKVAPGTIRRWASQDRWHPYGTRAGRLWNITSAQRSYDKRRARACDDTAMRKIPTLFVRDPNDMRKVLHEVHPECQWVIDGEGEATRKYDGTCVLLDHDGIWFARREVKPGKTVPSGYVEVDTDPVTGKTVGWEPIDQSPFVKAWQEALGNPHERRAIGTYELCGPKINGNPEGYSGHVLIRHGDADLLDDAPRDFNGLVKYFADFPHEGIVWHHVDGRMTKIKRRDFGLLT